MKSFVWSSVLIAFGVVGGLYYHYSKKKREDYVESETYFTTLQKIEFVNPADEELFKRIFDYI